MKARRTIIVCFGILIVAGMVAFVVAWQQSRSRPAAPSGHRTLTGQVTCLPKKGSGPQTLECALGIKTQSGAYYAVKNDNDNVREAFIRNPVGTQVNISGDVSAPSTSEIYDIAGVITAVQVSAEN